MIRLSATRSDAYGHRWSFIIEVDGRVHIETTKAESVVATLTALNVKAPKPVLAHACQWGSVEIPSVE